MKTYVVIPNYFIDQEHLDLARVAVNSFKKTDVQIIMVDDCSPIDASKIFKDTKYIRRKKNGGFAACCNTGFKYVLAHEKKNCYIVCANNDIEVYKDWHQRLKELLDRGYDMAGGLGFRDRTIYGQPLADYDKNVSGLYNTQHISIGGLYNDWYFPGGFWMMNRNILEDVGLLDENFIHGGMEDIDFFHRVQKDGKLMAITPKVWYWHKEGATRRHRTQREIQNEAMAKNIEYFKQKHGICGMRNLNQILKDTKIEFYATI